MEITLYCVAIAAAAVITGILGKFMIPFLHKLKFGQTIREEGPTWHAKKQGTPTMGGLMFIIGGLAAAVICISFLWMQGGAETTLMVVKVAGGALMALGFGIVGFLDDYISIKKHRNLGLTEIQKLILGDEQPLKGRYADTLKPVVEDTRKKLGDLAKTDEDVLSYIAFPNLAEKFLEERKAKEENVATYSIVEC